MRIHHVCQIVSDMDEALKLYVDFLGFRVVVDQSIPGGRYFSQPELDDIFKVKDARSRMVILWSEEKTMIELQQPSRPVVQKVPVESLRYGYVGFSELAFKVDNIAEWFEKVKASPYQMQTDYIWEIDGILKSFLFYDNDGCMIQMIEDV